ncbi:MAG: hypothetical protein PHR28_13900 [candidate division Zixibacteria bacterium]|jgi:hypothetical protein|nr:hypothetical protein [candidate division Zixibacteria bacterium]
MISENILQNTLERIDDVEEQIDLICRTCTTYPSPFHQGCPYILSNDQIVCPAVKTRVILPRYVPVDEDDDETDEFDSL